MDKGHKKEYFYVMYTSYKNMHAFRDTLVYIESNHNDFTKNFKSM